MLHFVPGQWTISRQTSKVPFAQIYFGGRWTCRGGHKREKRVLKAKAD